MNAWDNVFAHALDQLTDVRCVGHVLVDVQEATNGSAWCNGHSIAFAQKALSDPSVTTREHFKSQMRIMTARYVME